MRKSKKLIALILATVILTALSGCAKDYGSNIEPRAEVNRTYEKIVPATLLSPENQGKSLWMHGPTFPMCTIALEW